MCIRSIVRHYRDEDGDISRSPPYSSFSRALQQASLISAFSYVYVCGLFEYNKKNREERHAKLNRPHTKNKEKKKESESKKELLNGGKKPVPAVSEAKENN